MSKNAMIKRSLSIFLALIIFVLSVPLVFAAEPVTLTKDNVTEWPTAVYKDGGKLYLGQKDGDVVSWEGGKVEYNGTEIPGHFEFIDPDAIQTLCGNVRANLKFIPDDLTAYTSFEATRLRNVTYTVSEIPIVFIDKVNDPLIATEVEAGASLSTSVLSGGKVKSLISENDPNLEGKTWKWTMPSTVVQESGLYEAIFTVGNGYESLREQVQVNIKSEIPETQIVEKPFIAELTYNPNVTFADVILEGGKAVVKGTDTEVDGKFEFLYKNGCPNPSVTEVVVVFTPNDPEAALPYQFTIPIKVNPAPLSFRDAEGNIIADSEFVFEVEPKEKLLDVQSRITDYLNVPENSVVGFENSNGRAENGKEYTLKVFHDDPYYVGNELTFTAKFKETKIEPRLAPVGPNKWRIDCNGYYPDCQFIVYYEVNGVTKELARVNANNEFNLDPKTSGNYTIRIVYDKTEDDYFIIDEMVLTNDVKLSWSCSSTGGIGSKVQFGDTVVREAPETDPAKADKPYYSFVKWEDANGNTGLDEEALSNREITFTMPDGDVKLEATYRFDFIMFLRYIFTTIINWFESVFASIGTLF